MFGWNLSLIIQILFLFSSPGSYYPPSQYCLPPRHQRLPVPANQYPFNYRVDPGISHVQYRASAMFDIHAMPVPPLYTDPWKKQGSHFDPKKENYIQKTVPTSGPFPDHSGWEQSVTSAKVSIYLKLYYLSFPFLWHCLHIVSTSL